MVILERQQGEIYKMTQHIYRVLEIIGSEKYIIRIKFNNLNLFGINISGIKIFNDLEVSLYMNGLDIKNLSHKIIFNYRIASLYMVTQRLKIFLLNNFEV